MIPKIIHYCWFGKQPKPEIVLKCIESWKKYCPDWEIIEWNESNFDVSQHPYMKEAYEKRKWAFVSDVARLLIIYSRGGYTWIRMLNYMHLLMNWRLKELFLFLNPMFI